MSKIANDHRTIHRQSEIEIVITTTMEILTSLVTSSEKLPLSARIAGNASSDTCINKQQK